MSSANGQLVTATDVSRRYGEGEAAVDALLDVSTGFERGRLTGIMGPSGSGKSTLMHILAGLAGVLAATPPARRASRLNVLDSLHYE